MSAVPHAAPPYQRIIVHHLSDLHYHQDIANKRQDPLVRYRGYLEGLPPDRRPDMVAITGDLTKTGDRNDLNTVAAILRNDFPRWDRDLAQRVFVVPGPRDVNWDGTDAPGLTAFYEAFRDFGLPSATHKLPTSGTQAGGSRNYIAYSLDTCYTLEDFRVDLKEEFHEHARTYHDFVMRYQKAARGGPWAPLGIGKRDKKAMLADVRERYLRLTEGNQLPLLDAGRVAPADLAAFKGWADSPGKGQLAAGAAGAPGEPLKILITHHPLAVQPDEGAPTPAVQPLQRDFRQLATMARDAGFHLALHGHIHRPQVLSDLSIMQGADTQHPLRQIGAGSLGDSGMFNEITATYRVEGGLGQWRLEIRTINVLADKPDDASSLVLLNPTEAAAEHAERLERDARTRDEFDSRLRQVMRQFSEAVYKSQLDDRLERKSTALPQTAMQNLESIIREIVFKDCSVRVRLLLKDREGNRAIPKLTAAYLAPPPSEGPGTLTYPASIAAWSLVLGRHLSYPKIEQEELSAEDYDWLGRSGKVPELLKILEALMQRAAAVSFPDMGNVTRYQTLHDKLKEMGEPRLRGMDLYQGPPKESPPPTYPYFISVPFPRRPAGGSLPEVPEIAVLDVGVRLLEKAEGKGDAPTSEPANPFTEERIHMLESLAELAGVILMASSALDKPKGVWDDRFRV